jgi:two-component system LytT family response regulator
LKFGDRFIPLETKDIAYLFAADKAVFAQTQDKRPLPLDDTLDELEGQLNPTYFFRVNRAILATRSSIKQIVAHFNGRLKLTLTPDTVQEVYVSRERAGAFRAWMNH